MTTKLERMSALLREQQDKKASNGTTKTGGDNASYPFWNIDFGANCVLRYLPDGDASNPFFYVPRETIKLVFDGQVGGDYPTSDAVTVTVPCVDMFQEKTCPIIAAIRPLWKQGPEKEAIAKQYYKKKSFLYQGFVVTSPFEEKEIPENPIRRFVINPSIQKIIAESLTNPEFEESPDDYVCGRDFTIRKTKQGEYANYGTSGWRMNARALSEAENIAIAQYKLFNLGEFRGPRPDAEGIALIKAMFDDSFAGKPFDFAAYGHAYRAYGSKNGNNAPASDPDALSTVAATPRVAPAVSHQTVSKPVDEDSSAPDASATGGDKPAAADILARIRNKKLAAGQA